MLLRILLWLAALYAGWRLLKPRARRTPWRGGSPGARAVAAPEPMVDCAHCGLHLPRSESVRGRAGTAFCSAAHLAAGPRRVG
jgi:uncharacterized protein